MGKFKIGLKLDVSYLEDLHSKKTTGISIQKSKQHMALHPIHLKNFSISIKDILDDRVAKYDKQLDGIMLGYRNIRLLNEKGVIHNDSGGIHVDLEGDFFVFKPLVGKEIQGKVIRTGPDFVGVLVYKTFNVSIPKPPEEQSWLGDDIKKGCEVLFKIEFVDTSLQLPYIRGELISIISGQKKNKKKNTPNKEKQRKTLFEDIDADVDVDKTTIDSAEIPNIKEEKLKTKSKKEKEISPDSVEPIESNTKHSKKRKMPNNEDIENESQNENIVKKEKKRKRLEISS